MPEIEKRIDKYLSREYQLIVIVVSILSAFYFLVLCPLNDQRASIESIKNNHLAHIENDIVEIRKKQAARDLSDAERDIKIERILTILENNYK